MPATLRTVMLTATAALAVATTLTVAPGAVAGPAPGRAAPGAGRVEVEIPGPEHGGRAGSGHAGVAAAGKARTPAPLSGAQRERDGAVTALVDNGASADRLDIVIVGDGYTAAEQEKFHADARQNRPPQSGRVRGEGPGGRSARPGTRWASSPTSTRTAPENATGAPSPPT